MAGILSSPGPQYARSGRSCGIYGTITIGGWRVKQSLHKQPIAPAVDWGARIRGLPMKGQVLDYSVQTNAGLISGDDGVRYSFEGANWNESIPPQRGMRVDFEADGNRASSIYADLSQGGGAPVGIAVPQPGNVSQPGAGAAVRASSKSNILAALLAFF